MSYSLQPSTQPSPAGSYKQTVLIITPMPLLPASAGNRRRALEVCNLYKQAGYRVHLGLLDHENQIYRWFGHEPPCDMEGMKQLVDELFLIETASISRLKTGSFSYFVDDWYPSELDTFAHWYLSEHGSPSVVLVNYVFLSAFLENWASTSLRLIDTHDRFSGRKEMYDRMRIDPNFFYTTEQEEAIGLNRADLVIAIQTAEAEFFSNLLSKPVVTLGHRPKVVKPDLIPSSLERFGFLGHGNDANVISISRFAHAWAEIFPNPGSGPTLVVAGEVSNIFGSNKLPNVEIIGYVPNLDSFYNDIDAIVAPLVMGTGLKIKVIEALGRDKIVLGTDLAFEGLNTIDSTYLFKHPNQIIEFIRDCRTDSLVIHRLSANARSLLDSYLHMLNEEEKILIAAGQNVGTVHSGAASIRQSEPVNVPDFHCKVALKDGGYLHIKLETAPAFDQKEKRIHSSQACLIATERRLPQTRLATTDLGFAFSAERMQISIETDLSSEISKSIGSSEDSELDYNLLVAKISERKFIPEAGFHAIGSLALGNKNFLKIIHSIYISCTDWISVGTIEKRDGKFIISALLSPRLVRRKNITIEAIVKHSQDEYDMVQISSNAFVLNREKSKHIRSSSTISQDALLPIELQLTSWPDQIEPVSDWTLAYRIGSQTGLISGTEI